MAKRSAKRTGSTPDAPRKGKRSKADKSPTGQETGGTKDLRASKGTKKATRKSKPTKAKTTKAKPPTRRPRSRGKRRNPKTAAKHATNSLEAAAGLREPTDNPLVEPPEHYRPGPSVSLLDGSASLSRERQVIEAMLGHPEWQIPQLAYNTLPNLLTQISLNIGLTADGDQQTGVGTYTVNQQLTAMRILERFHAANLKKLIALKPAEVRLLNDDPTPVTVDDQRFAAIAAITTELRRRQSGGATSG